MAWRGRIRRAGKWTGTGICLLILAVAGVNLHWRVYWINKARHCVLGVVGGSVLMIWREAPTGSADFSPTGWVFMELDGEQAKALWIKYAGRINWDRSYYLNVSIPLWIFFLTAAIPTGWLWWRDRRRIPPGHCRRCGYNLMGNVSGVCPECGEKL